MPFLKNQTSFVIQADFLRTGFLAKPNFNMVVDVDDFSTQCIIKEGIGVRKEVIILSSQKIQINSWTYCPFGQIGRSNSISIFHKSFGTKKSIFLKRDYFYTCNKIDINVWDVMGITLKEKIWQKMHLHCERWTMPRIIIINNLCKSIFLFMGNGGAHWGRPRPLKCLSRAFATDYCLLDVILRYSEAVIVYDHT